MPTLRREEEGREGGAWDREERGGV